MSNEFPQKGGKSFERSEAKILKIFRLVIKKNLF